MDNADVAQSTPRRRRRSPRPRWWSLLLLLAAIAAGCSGTTAAEPPAAVAAPTVSAAGDSALAGDDKAAASPSAPAAGESPPPAASTSTSTTDPLPAVDPTPTPIAPADTELPAAPIGFDQLAATVPASGPQPVSIEIEDINVAGAPIIAVGVNEDLTFEVPPADQVGWYEFGPVPGQAGSAVLAAHIAYDGVDGVFRNLGDADLGSIVRIGFDDGSVGRYRITEVAEFLKDELPNSLFDRTGDARLALITCGGSFNPQLRSYESNTVAIAVPA